MRLAQDLSVQQKGKSSGVCPGSPITVTTLSCPQQVPDLAYGQMFQMFISLMPENTPCPQQAAEVSVIPPPT
jgi:hypothetical protein